MAVTQRCRWFALARPRLYHPRSLKKEATPMLTDTASQAITDDALPVLPTNVDASAPDYQENAAIMRNLVAELRERLRQVAQGGGEGAIERHRSRGKLLARERIDLLLDPGTPFLELSPLAAWEMYDNDAPSAGIVTGVGVVCGHE